MRRKGGGEKKNTLSAKYDKETKVFGISYFFFLQHMQCIARIVELHIEKGEKNIWTDPHTNRSHSPTLKSHYAVTAHLSIYIQQSE